MHFDSDETAILEESAPKHPIASCVLYLNDYCGGPTIVTNQVINSSLATCGWLCFPVMNRLVAFDAKYLHGIIKTLLLYNAIKLHVFILYLYPIIF
jgi:hypothetical protein